MSAKTTRPRMRCPPAMDLSRFPSTTHGHDFDGLSRVVMVRKTEQRTFASTKNGEEPKLETVTRETIETFHGNKTERKVTSLETRDAFEDFSPELLQSMQTPSHSAKISTPKKSVSDSSSITKVRKTSVSKTPDEFAAECLKAHNEYRIKHGVPPLKLNKKICFVSQSWANTLAMRGALEHSKNRDYGENLFCITPGSTNYQINGKEPVDNWYGEITEHIFELEPKTLATSHFTQVVWKETTELGVAFAKSRKGNIFVVANYSPPGNFIGQYSVNVPPVGGFRTNGVRTNGSSSPPNACNGVQSAPTTPKSPSVANSGEDFENACLKAHNEYRKLHGVEPLKLNKKMCKYSEEWAKVLASKGLLEHRKNSEYGENLFCSWSSSTNYTISGREPVENWYKEMKDHVFGREPSNLKTGHFTQVVWKTSKELGVGMAKNRNGQIFVVVNYSPPGNFVGCYVDNVFPVGGCPVKRETKEAAKSEGVRFNTDEDFSRDGVKVHNEYRRKHSAPDLQYSSELTKLAKDWAETLAREDRFYHRPNGQYGENIYYFWSSDPNAKVTPRDVCKKWYDEINNYTWGVESRMQSTGHFTQMVWKSTTEMGMAIARNKNGKVYVVANYNPRGNCFREFMANVLRPR